MIMIFIEHHKHPNPRFCVCNASASRTHARDTTLLCVNSPLPANISQVEKLDVF
jgi:hypothetical protein